MRAIAFSLLALPSAALAFTPDDPFYPQQTNLQTIGASGAWDVARGDGVRVAVIDTGVSSDHPDGPVGLRMDLGFDFVNQDELAEDGNGYGTFIAGVIAAELNNGIGVAGLAPEVEIVPIQVLSDQGQGSFAAVIVGIDHAIAQDVDIITLALGQPDSPLDTPGPIAVAEAVDRATAAGILVVAAAGDHGGDVSFPALMPEVIAVGAVDDDDNRTEWSAGGADLDIVAPGVAVTTLGLDGTYVNASGTAFATAQVSAAAALVWSSQPDLTADEVRSRLLLTARDLGPPGVDTDTGYGLLRVGVALGLSQCHDSDALVDALTAERDALADQVDDLTADLVVSNDALLECDSERDVLESDLAECETRASTLADSLALAERELEEQGAFIASLQVDLQLAQQQTEFLSGQVAELTSALDASNASLSECAGLLSEAEGAVAACESDLAACAAELDACADSDAANASELADCQEDLGTCGDDLDVCDADLGSCEATLDAMERDLDRAQDCLLAVDRLGALPPWLRRFNPWGYTRRTFNDDRRCDRIVTRMLLSGWF